MVLMPVSPTRRRLRQEDYCEFEDSLGYTESSSPSLVTESDATQKTQIHPCTPHTRHTYTHVYTHIHAHEHTHIHISDS